MIKTVLRTEVLKQKNLRALIGSLQQFIYTDWIERTDSEREKTALREYFDCIDSGPTPYVHESLIFAHPSTSLNHYPAALARSFSALLRLLQVDNYYMIAHLPHQLMHKSPQNYAPLKRAYNNLKQISPPDSRKHAFLINNAITEKLISSIFWIHRCDQSVPEYVFFAPDDDSFVISVCKYGNIHFQAFTAERAEQVKAFYKQANLIPVSPPERDRFTKQ